MIIDESFDLDDIRDLHNNDNIHEIFKLVQDLDDRLNKLEGVEDFYLRGLLEDFVHGDATYLETLQELEDYYGCLIAS